MIGWLVDLCSDVIMRTPINVKGDTDMDTYGLCQVSRYEAITLS